MMKKFISVLLISVFSVNAFAAQCFPARDAKGNVILDPDAITRFKQLEKCPDGGEPKMSCQGYKPVPIVPLVCCGDNAARNFEYWPSKLANQELKRQNKWSPSVCQSVSPFGEVTG